MAELVINILRDLEKLALDYTTLENFKTVSAFVVQFLTNLINVLPAA